jgi:MFS family permease
MSLGECIYDSIQGPLVAELAPEDLLSRYMAVSGFSWQLGFIAGGALAGLVLGAEPNALWAADDRALPRRQRLRALARPTPAGDGSVHDPRRSS